MKHTYNEEEIPLTGGTSKRGVVRTGDTVRRPLKADSDLIHALPIQLERCGFQGAPRYLGADSRGSPMFSFIEGFAPPHNGFRLSEDGVRAGARLIRTVHDLTEGTEFGGLVDAMLATVRNFQTIVEGDQGAMDWAAAELAYVERNADVFRVYLPR